MIVAPRAYWARNNKVTVSAEKGGEGRQSTEKPGGEQQPRFRRQARMVGEHRYCQPHQVTAYHKVGCQRTQRQRRKYRVPQKSEPPAQPRAHRRARTDGEQTVECHCFRSNPPPALPACRRRPLRFFL